MALPDLTRRSFLEHGLLALAAVLAGIRPRQRGVGHAVNTAADLLAHLPGAAVIGHEYLKLVPHENDAEILTALVLGNTNESRAALELRESLCQRIRSDFSRGQTVRLDGWILSRTECRLCALAALRS